MDLIDSGEKGKGENTYGYFKEESQNHGLS